jgi:hypothetical protein
VGNRSPSACASDVRSFDHDCGGKEKQKADRYSPKFARVSILLLRRILLYGGDAVGYFVTVEPGVRIYVEGDSIFTACPVSIQRTWSFLGRTRHV